MSWLNLSRLKPRGSGKAEWQSMQEFVVCPCAKHAATTKPASRKQRAARDDRSLFRQMAIDTHPCYVGKGKDCEPCDPLLRTCRLVTFKKRQQSPPQTDEAE